MANDVVNFNSHAHVERDGWIDNALIFRTISTHTLTWSVTRYKVAQQFVPAYFNSHAHVERDYSRCGEAS